MMTRQLEIKANTCLFISDDQVIASWCAAHKRPVS